MLTISRLARYVGTTTRAIRHYHAIGLLPAPERTPTGYRVYSGRDVIALRRIRTLTEAGVPLRRVRELLDAPPDAFRAAVQELAEEVEERIAVLQQTRSHLRALADGDDPFLPPGAVEIRRRMRALGVSERTLNADREGWILTAALYPEVADQWLRTQLALTDDPEWGEITVATDRAADWPADDPRLRPLARRSAAFLLRAVPADLSGGWAAGEPVGAVEGWRTGDPKAFELVTRQNAESSVGWARLTELIQRELALLTAPSGKADPGTAIDESSAPAQRGG